MAYLLNQMPTIELPRFIADLAHYECMELMLETAESNDKPANFPVLVKPLTLIPQLNPVLHVLHYRYPVQSITATDEYWKNWQTQLKPYEQKSVILTGYRDLQYNIHFVELNSITARLIELLEKQTRNQEHVLLQLADEINYDDPKKFMSFGMDILNRFTEQQIIVGAINES